MFDFLPTKDAVTHDVRVDHDVEMTTRDGVVLRADVYRPNIRSKVPAIILRTPYDKGSRGYSNPYLPAMQAARAGFAYVVQDIRGRFASDGEWAPFSPEIERPDGYDCVEWTASEKWCNGNVGMIGVSNESFHQFCAAVERPPSLKAIAPNASGYLQQPGVITISGFTIAWTAGMAAVEMMRALQEGRPVSGEHFPTILEALNDPVKSSQHLPLRDHPLAKIPMADNPFLWSLREDLQLGYVPWEDVGVPALFTNGWYDACVPSGIDQFGTIRAKGYTEAARTGTKMIIGPWDHGTMTSGLQQGFFGVLASGQGAGVVKAHLEFFSRHLRGDAVAELPTIKYFVMGANVWKQADEWPPPGVEQRPLFLRSGGGLEWEAPAARESLDRFDYDPMQPVPSFGVRAMAIGGEPVGPVDQYRIEARPDVLVYSTEVLDRPVEVAGDVELVLYASSSVRDTDFFTKLCDVSPEGISLNLVDGLVRARWRGGIGAPEFLEADEVYEFRIALGPIAHEFGPGHRIRVQVTSSSFPYWDRNMNTGNAVGVDASGPVAHQTVHHSNVYPSRLLVHVAP